MNIWFYLQKIIKYGFFTYIAIATIVGTLVMGHIAILVLWNAFFAPAPLPIHLPNGFRYTDYSHYVLMNKIECRSNCYHSDPDHNCDYCDSNDNYDQNYSHGIHYVITDETITHIVVYPDVKEIMWHEDKVYGYRDEQNGDSYYFICSYGTDCTDTQHYSKEDFESAITTLGLPEYSAKKAKNYDQLLWKQSKTDIGKHGG